MSAVLHCAKILNNMKQTQLDSLISSNKSIVEQLGTYLYAIVNESNQNGNNSAITQQDCIDYIHDLTIREKSVINDGLAKLFPELTFEETNPELDHAGDIDYIAKIGNKAIGIQIKPVTAKANFGSYSLSERMKASFADFTEQFGGKVFIVFSLDKEIANKEVVNNIKQEVERLRKEQNITTTLF